MRTVTRWTVLMAVMCVLSVRADDPASSGAKELFGGGTDDEIVDAPSSAGGSSARSSKKATTKTRKPVQADAQAKNAFGLRHWIELIEPGKPDRRVTGKEPFRSGDRIRLHFQSNEDGHIAIVALGTSGTSTVLFPDAAKDLTDDVIRAGSDRVLPSPDHWFRFDAKPGKERLLVFFAKDPKALAAAFPTQQSMDTAATAMLVRNAETVSGSKDLVIETVESDAMYAVNTGKKLVVLEITLEHH